MKKELDKIYDVLDNQTINDFVNNLIKKPAKEIKNKFTSVSNSNVAVACKVGIDLISKFKEVADREQKDFIKLCDNGLKTLNDLYSTGNLNSEIQSEIIRVTEKIIDKADKADKRKKLFDAGVCLTVLGSITILGRELIRNLNKNIKL